MSYNQSAAVTTSSPHTTTVYPQDKEIAGQHYWNTMFNIASQYPDYPTRENKLNTSNLLKSIISQFTCQDCIDHAFEFIRNNPIKLDDKESLVKWLCSLKNNANEHAGKPIIDCNDFVMNSLNRQGGCKSCNLEDIKAPSVNMNPKNMPIPPPPPSPPKLVIPVGSVLDYEQRYPSLKRAILADGSGVDRKGGITTNTTMNDMAKKYPSLATFEETVQVSSSDQAPAVVVEELDGVLKPLDNLYSMPAGLVDIKPSDFNLAYTPEMVTNLMSMVSQIYLTNTGSLLTNVVGSLGLLGISIFAKSSLSYYDRLFLQNVVGSMLFHTFNFINPRVKDEVMEDCGKLYEGITTMDFEKIKEAMLFSGDGNKGDGDEKSNKELMAEIIDMDKMGMRQHHAYEGAIGSIPTVKSGISDLRMLGGHGGLGSPISRDEIQNQFNGRSRLTSPMEYRQGRHASGSTQLGPDLGIINDIDDKYSYILDNNLF